MSRTIITHKNKIPINNDGLVLSSFIPIDATHWIDFSQNVDTLSGTTILMAKNLGTSGINLYNSSPTQSLINQKSFDGKLWASYSVSSQAVVLGTQSNFTLSHQGTFFLVSYFNNYPTGPGNYNLYAITEADPPGPSGATLSALKINQEGLFYIAQEVGTYPSNTSNSYIDETIYDFSGTKAIHIQKYSLTGPTTTGKTNGITGSTPPLLEATGTPYSPIIHLGISNTAVGMMIGEWIYYDYQLSDEETSLVEKYLRTKWNINY